MKPIGIIIAQALVTTLSIFEYLLLNPIDCNDD